VKKSRSQIVNRIFEAIGIGLVAIDLLVFFALYRPLGSKMDAAEHRHEELRQTIRNQQVRVEILKKYDAAFPRVGKGLQDFASNRTPSRREAYSTAAHLIHKIADAAGVKVVSTGYRLQTAQHNDPLEPLQLDISLEGSYGGLLKFSHALETANDFILVREFNFSPGSDNQGLGLRLGADFYVTP
jgi:Tfp pilus assembly protein PilO